jgi:plasmid stabilization system protein ParE
VPLRWVSVRDPFGRFDPQALLATDVTVSAEAIVRYFVRRWRVEVTFQETRRHLGVETQRQWSNAAIACTTPVLLALFSGVTLLATRLVRDGRLSVRTAAWYVKHTPTFSDALGRRPRALVALGAFPNVAVRSRRDETAPPSCPTTQRGSVLRRVKGQSRGYVVGRTVGSLVDKGLTVTIWELLGDRNSVYRWVAARPCSDALRWGAAAAAERGGTLALACAIAAATPRAGRAAVTPLGAALREQAIAAAALVRRATRGHVDASCDDGAVATLRDVRWRADCVARLAGRGGRTASTGAAALAGAAAELAHLTLRLQSAIGTHAVAAARRLTAA